VDRDAERVTVLGEAPGNVDQDALLDVVQDLLVAGFIADRSPLSRSTFRVLCGTFGLALQDQVTPSFLSSLAISSARGQSSVNVSSSKKNSLTCGNACFAQAISSTTWPTERLR